jgi:hypothetical protein
MPHFLAPILALLVPIIPLANGQNCSTHKLVKRTSAKGKEAKASAQLAKARALLGAGKRKQAIRRLRKIIWRYSITKAGGEKGLMQ